MTNAFEYGDALLPEVEGKEGEPPESPQIGSNQPYLNLATFRMVVLADEVLEAFFETDLSASFRLEPVPLMELPPANNGFLGGIWSNIASDDNKKLFHKFSDELGKTIGKHQVVHRPSIGRYTTVEEPKARESLLSPHMRRSSSKSSLQAEAEAARAGETASVKSVPSTLKSATESTLSVETKPGQSVSMSEFSPIPMVQAANAALMERTAFAIDDAKDEDEEEESGFGVGDDDGVMDEVCSSLLVVSMGSFAHAVP